MTNQNKVILDLCGGTGSWSKPYADAGYCVINITLPQYDVLNFSASGGHLLFGAKDPMENLVVKTKDVYGVLAAPTCTMFSLARTTAKTPRDLRGGMELVHGCLNIIHECLYDGDLKFWALENPMGYLRKFLGRPPLTFDPCDYGDHHTKKTDLWGYYNAPKKAPVTLTEEQKAKLAINNRDLPTLPPEYVLPDNFSRQAARRSMTPQGFATAFFKANK